MTEQERDRSTGSIGAVFVVVSLFKLLLIPAYRSTDFEVHRNWLAITWSLKPHEWYFENTSRWTLDYPPLFAWFERFLARFAYYFDPGMLQIDNLEYQSKETIMFQRLSVICSDCVLLVGIILFVRTWPSVTTTEIQWSYDKAIIVSVLALSNVDLLLVDHIHFQYNGFLLGLLVISISLIRRGDSFGDVAGGVVFAVLLMLKHIFLYIAPLYFVYLLRHYCWRSTPLFSGLLSRGFQGPSPKSMSRNGISPKRIFSDQNISEKMSSSSSSLTNSFRSYGSLVKLLSTVATASLSVPKDLDELGESENLENKTQQQNAAANESSSSRSRTISQLPDLVSGSFNIYRFLFLGVLVGSILVFSISSVVIGHEDPFLALFQLASRLFPVERGLIHAYWAPNFWALYTGLDKALFASLRWISPMSQYVQAHSNMTSQMTGGLVGTSQYLILPQIPAILTAVLAFGFMIPALQNVWNQPHPKAFLPALIYCTLCSFMFGYHVHEKAILMGLIPLTLTACDSAMDARLYLLMSWIAHVSLSPLLFTPDVAALKPILFFMHSLGSYLALDAYHINARRARRIRADRGGFSFRQIDWLFSTCLLAVYFFCEMHPWLGNLFPADSPLVGKFPIILLYHRFPFLPLMLNSVCCACGLIICWNQSWQQLIRKQAAIATYQPSPKGPNPEASRSFFFGGGVPPIFQLNVLSTGVKRAAIPERMAPFERSLSVTSESQLKMAHWESESILRQDSPFSLEGN